MEIIGRVSKGSKMDQIYLPKNRFGMETGSYVLVKLVNEEELSKNNKEISKKIEPFFYGLKRIEPIKVEIIRKVFDLIEKNLYNCENIIIIGSFLEMGFDFKDLDILLINSESIDKPNERKSINRIADKIENEIGIKAHILSISPYGLRSGLASDPLYENMLSKCVSKNRMVFNIKRIINCQILDAHLLKSKDLFANYSAFNGREKYYLVKNMISILLFLEGEKINSKNIDKRIQSELKISIDKIKENLLDKNDFLKNYKKCYSKTFNLIMNNTGGRKTKNEPE